MAVNTWNIAPDYDEWGVDSSWTAADWIQWHKLLKEKFGKDKAKIAWEYAYAKNGAFAKAWDYRVFNSGFRQYVQDENLDPYVNAGLFDPLLKGYATVSDVFDSVTDGISGVFGGSKTGKTVVTVILIAGISFAVFKGVQAFKMLKSE